MVCALNGLTKVQDDLAKVSKSQKTCKSCTLIHRAEPGVSSQHKTPLSDILGENLQTRIQPIITVHFHKETLLLSVDSSL